MNHREWNESTLVMLLAGGQGERLYPLTKRRAKPAVPFAGLYRIVDFTLSNCLNSGLRRVFVLTQHKSLSLDRHLRVAWSILQPDMGEFIQSVPPQLSLVSRWYAGTADAVFQNLDLLEEERARYTLIVSGDHIYRMDYREMLQFHADRDADLTVACTEVSVDEATRMGVIQVDGEAHIRGFAEKPTHPATLPNRAGRCLASMGVYVFKTEALVRSLIADAKSESTHDFGHDVIPSMLSSARRLCAFDVIERLPPTQRYWQDVGTLDSYFETNMDLLGANPPFNLFDPGWAVRTHIGHPPPALLRNADGYEARAVNCIVSPGCMLSGAQVFNSVLSPGVQIDAGATIESCILMPNVRVGAGATLRRSIVDENVVIPPGMQLGCDVDADRSRYTVTKSGVVVVGEGTLLGGSSW